MALVQSQRRRERRAVEKSMVRNLQNLLFEEKINMLIQDGSETLREEPSQSQTLQSLHLNIDDDQDQSLFDESETIPECFSDSKIDAVMCQVISQTCSENCSELISFNRHPHEESQLKAMSETDSESDSDHLSSLESSIGIEEAGLLHSEENSGFCGTISPAGFDSVESTNKPSLSEELGLWAIEQSVTVLALDKLLKILRNHNNPDLPKCAKTVLHTPRTTKDVIRLLGGGQYSYFGIANGIFSRLSPGYLANIEEKTFEIDVFVDGISPYRSSKTHLWVISGCLTNMRTPFVIGLWCGKISEPSDVTEFFEDYVTEASSLLLNGLSYDDMLFQFKVKNYIADAPARSWIRQVKAHNAYHGCERCDLPGFWLTNRLTYDPGDMGELRTDQSFADQEDSNHHEGVSPLLKLGTKLVSQVPLEPMHLVYLGVMRRLVAKLVTGKKNTHKLKPKLIQDLSNYSTSLAVFFPSEFTRKPRSLDDWKIFKAVEYKRMLLYDGFLLFMNMKNNKLKIIHRLLSCAIRILSDETLVESFWEDADVLLSEFVKKSRDLFGQAFVVFNVHSLTHLAKECAQHGVLENFSAWKFESYLGNLKSLLHAPGKALQQIVCRLKERIALLPEKDEPPITPTLSKPHRSGPTLGICEQFSKLQMPNMTLHVPSLNDSCIITKDDKVVVVRNIVKTGNGIHIIGSSFKRYKPFFNYPFPSEKLGIARVRKLSSLKSWPISHIKKKAVLLPLAKPVPPSVTSHWMDSLECLCLPMFY